MSKRTKENPFSRLVGRDVSALYLFGAAPWRPADTSYGIESVDYDYRKELLTVTLKGGYGGDGVATLVVRKPSGLETDDGSEVIQRAESVQFDGSLYEKRDDVAVRFG